jgi:hypothetical protein
MYPLEHHASTSSEWLDWSSAGAHKQDRRVSVTVQFQDRLEPVDVRMLGADSPSLVASLAVADYAALEPGPAVTLRLVRTVENLLLQYNDQSGQHLPLHVGRTRREQQWLNDGGADPGPGASTPMRIHSPKPMPATQFWAVLDQLLSSSEDANALTWRQADSFTAYLRHLLTALATDQHHEQAVAAGVAARREADMLVAVVRQLAHTSPRQGECERSYEAMQKRARRALQEIAAAAGAPVAAPPLVASARG